MRTRPTLLALCAAALLIASPSPAHAAAESPSGTILSGTGSSPVTVWPPGMDGCVGAPTCSAWLRSGCRPALASKKVAVHAAIVDVEKFAGDARTHGLFVWGGAGINWGYVIVQFWTGPRRPGSVCHEILRRRLNVWYGSVTGRFSVPSNARWMTITSSPDNTQLDWALW
jgi:hypothetical protein